MRTVWQTLTHLTTNIKTATFITVLTALLVLPALSDPTIVHATGGINNTRGDAWGTLEVSGTDSNNLGGSGVAIYSNGSQVSYTPNKPNNTVNGVISGEEWQCVELVNRLYLTKGWTTANWPGYGGQLYDNAPSNLTKEPNGSVTYLNPGDTLVLQDSGSGHAAIINTYNSSTGAIQIESQNTNQVFDSTFSLSNRTISSTGWGTYSVKGIVHAPAYTGAARTFPDLTGDHKADVAWYENWNNGTMKVLTTSSTGTGVASISPWLVGWPKPDWAATGDFNGDGKQDVAWYTASDSTLRVLITGTGGFSYVYTWLTNYPKPDWAAVGDFNGDGKADIAWYVASNNGIINVLTTNSSGNGVASITSFVTGYGKPDWAGVGDFTGDGKADIAWYENWNNGTMKVLATNSTGTGVTSITNWVTGWATPTWARVGDFNGDGFADIAWYQSSDTSLKVLQSAGNGFGFIMNWLTGWGAPDWAGVGDFNGDGKSDIAWYENWNNGTMKVLTTNSPGNGIASVTVWFTNYGTPDWAGL